MKIALIILLVVTTSFALEKSREDCLFDCRVSCMVLHGVDKICYNDCSQGCPAELKTVEKISKTSRKCYESCNSQCTKLFDDPKKCPSYCSVSCRGVPDYNPLDEQVRKRGENDQC